MDEDIKKQTTQVSPGQNKASAGGINITVKDTGFGPKRIDPPPPDRENILNVPAMPLANTVLFPYALSPLVLSEKSSLKLIENAVAAERFVAFFSEMPEVVQDGTVHTVDGLEFDPERCTVSGRAASRIGTLGRIVKMLKFPDGTVRVLVRGMARVRYLHDTTQDGMSSAQVEKLPIPEDDSLETVAMVRNATKQFQEVISYSPNFPEELKIAILNLTDHVRIVDLIADTLNISFSEKLAILTIESLQERLHLLTILLNREVEVLRLGSEIQSQVHNVMSKTQREYYLREQLRQIKEELGEGERNPDVTRARERMEKLRLPDAVGSVLDKELERMEMIPQASPEYNISYTYVDWLLDLPWGRFTQDRLDISEASKILEDDHYGLKDVKERILEFLSVLQLKKDRKSPIICFVGPPGVGKTSLGKSIAHAMGRKFVRISLGGVRDEAEIRGHRRTYIGALPGRIIQGMKRAGSSNPVFMLDELDKLANDFRGDPASALLEVLDPQQNSAFNDHYLEVDYDLSNVMFIATANIQDTIPQPLQDRMEIIRLPGYTAMEKHQIAKQYLVKRQLIENGLTKAKVKFTRSGLDELITFYSMESGVRTLERLIGSVCRKIARGLVEGKRTEKRAVIVNSAFVQKMLGPRRFVRDESETKPQIGVALGMAWTSVGGSTLPVEATKMPGKGDLKLTGSLGDVMKESALAAFSYVRSHQKQFGLAPEEFTKNDFHVHVPDGATPKDGPSAGVTLTTALVSLLTGKPVRPRLAMTGEITLRGKVTPVGGIREKVIAATRSGVTDIILPLENKRDLEHVPDEVRQKIRFHFVSRIEQVLAVALPKVMPEDKPEATERIPDEVYDIRVAEEDLRPAISEVVFEGELGTADIPNGWESGAPTLEAVDKSNPTERNFTVPGQISDPESDSESSITIDPPELDSEPVLSGTTESAKTGDPLKQQKKSSKPAKQARKRVKNAVEQGDMPEKTSVSRAKRKGKSEKK